MEKRDPVTTSFAIANYCAPCRCLCRHCLLDSKYCAAGVEYARGEAFAERTLGWLRRNRPELSASFYAGYCMDFPQIERYIRFTGTPFLQCNGMGMKTPEEAEKWMRAAHAAGVRVIDCTFYGMQDAHDAFAGRKGDFAYLLDLIGAAQRVGIDAQASVALTKENMYDMPQLFSLLKGRSVQNIYAFFSHAKGRGLDLVDQRLTKQEFEGLCEEARAHFSSIPHHSEAEWIERGAYPGAIGRNVTLVLTPENIDRLEKMQPDAIIAELEEMDSAFYAAIPHPQELARLVGRPDNGQIYRFRDLYLEWQKRYIAKNRLDIYDMNDERHSFSVRMYVEREFG